MVFGKVVEGMEVVRRLQRIPVTEHDVPKKKVLISDCGELTNHGAPPKDSAFGGMGR